MLITLAGLKIAVATALGSVALGGVAAAATGSLPGPFRADDQTVASSSGMPSDSADPTDSASASASPSDGTTGDPSASPSAPSASAAPSGTWTPTRGPNPLGPAAWGLCHGFGNKTWGNGSGTPTGTPNPAGRKPNNPSVAYANLVAAAASEGLTVDQFCTIVLAGGTPSPAGSPTAVAGPSSNADEPMSGASHGHKHGQGHPNGSHGHGAGHGHGHG